METWPYHSDNVPSGCIAVNINGEPVWVRESDWTGADWTGAGGTLRDDELIMAVIEAARAFVPVAQDGSFSVAEWDRRFVRLADAVEALQEVEG